MLAGSLGMLPSASLSGLPRAGDRGKVRALYEPIHGSAPDIAGQGIANPIGTFWTAVLMLEHLGEDQASKNLMKAIESVTTSGQNLPKDLGGSAGTAQVTNSVCNALKDLYGKM